mmetsp:Transcript_29333/g.39146  ORF Transcript_29333/g.39146 Transcript_29333/m.39146 type:complete len:262 (-) Transcript_29333:482-1267(-)
MKQTIKRPDGRTGGGTLRPLASELSCLQRPDGSAKLSSGPTQILAAVYGPAAPRLSGREVKDRAVVSVVFKHGSKSQGGSSSTKGNGNGNNNNTGAPPAYGATERELEAFIAESLVQCIDVKRYPRTVIEIVIQVIKADGSVVGTAINAAVLALLDASIHMTSLPIACTCLVGRGIENNKDIRLDPTAVEEGDEDFSTIVIVTNASKERSVIASINFGSYGLSSFLSAIEGSFRASKTMVAFFRLAVEQKVVRESKTLWSS